MIATPPTGRDRSRQQPPVVLNAKDFDAAIFDLDGVVTLTARVHAEALRARAARAIVREALRRAGADIVIPDLAFLEVAGRRNKRGGSRGRRLGAVR